MACDVLAASFQKVTELIYHGYDACPVRSIVDFFTLFPAQQETCPTENGKLYGNRGLAKVRRFNQVAHGAFLPIQEGHQDLLSAFP